jgi:hypothetical protein
MAAELAWRWAFSASALALSAFAILRLQGAVVILPEEQQMLSSRTPLQIAEAVLEVWQRARPLVFKLGLIVIPAVIVLWLIAATVGRAYVLNRICQSAETKPNWLGLVTLNSLRVLSVIGLIGAYIACSRATTLVSNPESPNYFDALVVFLLLFSVAVLIWSFIHWILSLACIFAARERTSTIASLRRTVSLLRGQGRQLASVAAQNGTARTVVAILFSFLTLFPLVLYRLPILFWTLEFAILLLYCLASDLLLLARLSAYVELAEPTTISTTDAEN